MKKGDVAMNSMVVIILIIVGFLVITAVVTLFYNKFLPSAGSSGACRASNVLRGHSKLDVGTGPLKLQQDLIPSACKLQNYETTGTLYAVEQDFSDKIADCWWQWANGNWNNLLCEEKGVEPFASCDSSHCFVCYIVSIKDLKDNSNKPTTFTAADLRVFMRNKAKYYEDSRTGEIADSKTPDQYRKAVSYLDYIQYDGRGTMFFYDDLRNENNFVFESGSFYSIYYFEPHQTDFYKNWLGSGDSAADSLKDKRAIYIEKNSEVIGESGACKIKYGYDGK